MNGHTKRLIEVGYPHLKMFKGKVFTFAQSNCNKWNINIKNFKCFKESKYIKLKQTYLIAIQLKKYNTIFLHRENCPFNLHIVCFPSPFASCPYFCPCMWSRWFWESSFPFQSHFIVPKAGLWWHLRSSSGSPNFAPTYPFYFDKDHKRLTFQSPNLSKSFFEANQA